MLFHRLACLPAVFLLLAFLAAGSSAQSFFYENQSKGFLDSQITGTQAEIDFNESRSSAEINATVSNSFERPMEVFFAVKESGKWVVYKRLGSISPGQAQEFSFKVDFDYWNENVRTFEYALIGQTDGNVLVYSFNLQKDWQDYLEKNVRDVLVRAYIIVVPVVAILLAFLLFAVVDVAYMRKDDGQLIPGEYTIKSLFFPSVKGRPFKEIAADMLLNPIFWTLELLGGMLLVYLIFNQSLSILGTDVGNRVFVIAGMSALVMPVLYLVCAWIADYYEREPLRFIVSAFTWGILAAFLSFLVNTIGTGTIQAVFGEQATGGEVGIVLLGTALMAPVVEEVLKGLGVLVLSGHHEMDDALDGLLYGFAIGVGFSFIENWFYFALEANPFQWGIKAWLALILYRSFFNSLAHGCFTAATGAIIGYMKGRPDLKKFASLGFIPGVFAAILLHVFFNVGAILDTVAIFKWQFPIFIFNPVLVVILGVAFVIVFILATLDTKKRLQAAGG